MRGSVAPDLADRCSSCLLRAEWCWCAEIPKLEVQTRIIIIRHWKERQRTSNTGRLVHQAIPGTELVDYGAPGAPFSTAALDLSGAALLFPDGPAGATTPRTLVVVDGSWPQARKMARRVPGLGQLPRLHLAPADTAPARIRRPPIPNGMATIEAVARALDHLEGPGTGAPLDMMFARFVETHRKLRGKVRPRG